MDVTQTTATTPPAATAPTGKEKEAKSALSSDFETFLKMLTVQMQNQDPMNPLDSTEFAVQLATFSSVEQQVRTNDLLKEMAAQMTVAGMSQMAGWVGMEARSAGPVWFDGTPIRLDAQPASAADRMALVVHDASGQEVQRQELAPTAGPLSWAGVGANGKPLPEGAYTFSLQSIAKGTVLRTDALETYSRVIEARNEKGATVLVLEGGVKVAPTDVTALREPA
ncbi:flagellar hook capping FlgD N-terminal domain-containing protein [Roseitranquillus sediminis]|uniref:flagellar hook capping FlgD N-terminal domain-containing protein n=1 Tax=Roseitranquillus sediminis TaxID=2809051 RepID=UPI001D0C43B7|nr:flagellar hook capping FlgD N-terminal domain-containing protein [Roseitranquillus sediminis]MBM9596109.1 flagellar hook assembly protein FlgD [Roseitranquillus sediminis]